MMTGCSPAVANDEVLQQGPFGHAAQGKISPADQQGGSLPLLYG